MFPFRIFCLPFSYRLIFLFSYLWWIIWRCVNIFINGISVLSLLLVGHVINTNWSFCLIWIFIVKLPYLIGHRYGLSQSWDDCQSYILFSFSILLLQLKNFIVHWKIYRHGYGSFIYFIASSAHPPHVHTHKHTCIFPCKETVRLRIDWVIWNPCLHLDINNIFFIDKLLNHKVIYKDLEISS